MVRNYQSCTFLVVTYNISEWSNVLKNIVIILLFHSVFPLLPWLVTNTYDTRIK